MASCSEIGRIIRIVPEILHIEPSLNRTSIEVSASTSSLVSLSWVKKYVCAFGQVSMSPKFCSHRPGVILALIVPETAACLIWYVPLSTVSKIEPAQIRATIKPTPKKANITILLIDIFFIGLFLLSLFLGMSYPFIKLRSELSSNHHNHGFPLNQGIHFVS